MSALPPEAGPFLAAVAQDPRDPQPRLVFADWLEERGLPGAANASRWMADGHAPAHYPDYEWPWTWFVWSSGTLDFWAQHKFGGRGMLPRSPRIDLEGAGGRFFSNDSVQAGYWDFPTRDAAEQALLERWPDAGGPAEE